MKLHWVIQIFESFISVCGPLVASDVITNQKKKVITQRPVMMMIMVHDCRRSFAIQYQNFPHVQDLVMQEEDLTCSRWDRYV